jgi:hypothetical protein
MAAPVLRPASDLELPMQVVTESIAILGRRGAGKSNVAVVLAEEMFDVGVPWIAVDPKGDWWGIRSDRDGTGPGLPIPVFGGLHGDVPIEAGAGSLVADLLVDENLTAVLDVSDFSKGERARFLVGFCDQLFRRHRIDPQARHVFMEEAHEFIPQQMGREDGKLKEAASKIVLQGRSFGLGSSVCSQRSARIHKDVLTQTSILIALWTTGPQDRKAIDAWVTEHDAGEELVASLPTLKPGDGWIWATPFDLMQRTQFRQRRTFDSGSTPELGEARRVATIADVDTAAIKEQMAETIERAKADDPKELRKRIAVLERDLADRPNPEPQIEIVEVPLLDEKLVEMFVDQVDKVRQFGTDLVASMDVLAENLGMARAIVDGRDGTGPGSVRERAPQRTEPAPKPENRQVRAPARTDTGEDVRIGKRERSILQVLAQYPQGRSHRQIAMLTGYSPKASTISAGLAALRKAGYVEASGDPVRATREGVQALGSDLLPLPQGAALLAYWRGRLGARERKFLDVLLDAYPDPVTHDEMAEATGYSPDASTISAGMANLRGLEIADGWRLHEDFYEATRT